MMKKSFLSPCLVIASASTLLLTSCLGDGTNKMTREGFFTVRTTGSNYVLYQDYGGVVYPGAEFNSTLSSSKVSDFDRFYIAYQYTDDNIKNETGKGSYITNAELVTGSLLKRYSIFSEKEAESLNITASDSIFSAPSITSENIGIYRGFVTIQYSGKYSVVKFCEKCRTSFADSETATKCPTCGQSIAATGLIPTINLVYKSSAETGPDNIVFDLYYNQHSNKETQKQSRTDSFIATYPITSLIGFYGGGQGSVNVTFNVDGKPVAQRKISRDDLSASNYLYFQ